MKTSLLLAAVPVTLASTSINEATFPPEDVITKDVAIVGGGASGTYAAVRLREDLQTSVVLIESQNHLVTLSAFVLRRVATD